MVAARWVMDRRLVVGSPARRASVQALDHLLVVVGPYDIYLLESYYTIAIWPYSFAQATLYNRCMDDTRTTSGTSASTPQKAKGDISFIAGGILVVFAVICDAVGLIPFA